MQIALHIHVLMPYLLMPAAHAPHTGTAAIISDTSVRVCVKLIRIPACISSIQCIICAGNVHMEMNANVIIERAYRIALENSSTPTHSDENTTGMFEQTSKKRKKSAANHMPSLFAWQCLSPVGA